MFLSDIIKKPPPLMHTSGLDLSLYKCIFLMTTTVFFEEDQFLLLPPPSPSFLQNDFLFKHWDFCYVNQSGNISNSILPERWSARVSFV